MHWDQTPQEFFYKEIKLMANCVSRKHLQRWIAANLF